MDECFRGCFQHASLGKEAWILVCGETSTVTPKDRDSFTEELLKEEC